MYFDIPREIIFPVEDVHVALDPGPHPFEAANGLAIEANWAVETAANPALFDGRMALLSSLRYRGGLARRPLLAPFRYASSSLLAQGAP